MSFVQIEYVVRVNGIAAGIGKFDNEHEPTETGEGVVVRAIEELAKVGSRLSREAAPKKVR